MPKRKTLKPNSSGAPRRQRRTTSKRPPQIGHMFVKTFEEMCERQSHLLGDSALQALEILETYTKQHLLSCEPAVLRELLRTTLKFLPNGVVKTKIRGILAYFTRNPATKTFMRLAKILETVAKAEDITTFVKPKEVPFDRIVDETTILRISGREDNIDLFEITDAKIERLKKSRPRPPSEPSTLSLQDSEPPFWAKR